MDTLAATIMAEYKAKYPNAVLGLVIDNSTHMTRLPNAPTYEILLNGAGDRSMSISLRKEHIGITLIISAGATLIHLNPRDANLVMAILRAQIPNK